MRLNLCLVNPGKALLGIELRGYFDLGPAGWCCRVGGVMRFLRARRLRRRVLSLVLLTVTVGVCLGGSMPSMAKPETFEKLTIPATAQVGEDVAVTAAFRPSRRHPRIVVLKRWNDGAWVVVDRKRQDRSGIATFSVRHDKPGTYRYRAVALPWHGAARWTTPSRRVVVSAAPPDTTAPGPVSGVSVSGVTSDSLTLSWTKPMDADYAGVMLRRALGPTPPGAPGQGELVADVAAPGSSYTNTGLAAGTQYSYALFAHDAVPNLTPAATVTATTTGAPSVGRYVAGVSGNGRYFVDHQGDPILVKGDSPWAILVDASPSQMDAYVATRAGQGFNTVLVSLLGSTANGGPSDSGATYDGILPFVADNPARLNDAYWDRVEHFIAECRDAGITVMAYPLDGWVGTAEYGGLAQSWSTTTAAAYGAAVAARLSGYPNVIWSVGGDYTIGQNTEDARFDAVLKGLADGGMDRIATIQFTLNSTSLSSSYWAERVDFSFVYSYAPTYAMVETGYGRTTASGGHVPALMGEAHYESYAGVTDLYVRSQAAWALTSGSPGEFYGHEDVWDTAPVPAALNTTAVAQLSALRQAFESLPGWHRLVPDYASTFITGGRGTKADDSGEYFSGNTYVTGGLTSDCTLAVLYLPNATRTITLNTIRLGPGYTARWIDPTTGTSTPTGTGTTYTHTAPNAAGAPDWLLVLESTTPR